MAIDVETKDCTALTDAELAEMGDLCAAEGPVRYDIGLLSKEHEEWVLVSLARSNGTLQGYSFCTLERIGGTPSVLVGLATTKRTAKRADTLKALMGAMLRRAVLAFPDEDVLIGTRFVGADGFDAFSAFMTLHDVVPRPDHKPTGEDRAWGRRLAKRFGVDADYDERAFVAKGDGATPRALDHESAKPEKITDDVRALFAEVDPAKGSTLIAFGWAMAEDLAPLA
jgi:hypothetical protein